MHLLAVDTSLEQGSLALEQGGKICELVELSSGWKSTTLHAEIEGLLRRHGLKTANVDAYAVATGPGAFTSVRVGLAAVKGLAEAHSKPVVAVSTLQLAAAAGSERLPREFGGHLAAVLDARRGQVFAALYENSGEQLRLVLGERVGSLRSFLEEIRSTKGPDVRFCVVKAEMFGDEIIAAGWARSAIVAVQPGLAATLAQLAAKRLRNNGGVAAAQVDANYVRPSDAELFWKQ
jgi:tRNA threonylcarbamoyladenosine biosynthesis protein TsaB